MANDLGAKTLMCILQAPLQRHSKMEEKHITHTTEIIIKANHIVD